MSCRQLVASTLESNKKLSANELAIGVYGPWETLIRERRCRFWEWWADRFSLGELSSMPPQDTFLLVAKFLFQKCLEREVVVIKDFHDDDPTSEQITSKDKGGAICILSLSFYWDTWNHTGAVNPQITARPCILTSTGGPGPLWRAGRKSGPAVTLAISSLNLHVGLILRRHKQETVRQ